MHRRFLCSFVVLAAPLLGLACHANTSSSSTEEKSPTCSGLFGNPNAKTGLTLAECSPECVYASSTFVPPVYDASFVQSLVDDWAPATPYLPLVINPYDGSVPADDPPSMVCGVLPLGTALTDAASDAADDGGMQALYDLVTYDSADAAVAAGASVTHFGHCGVCSTLANLAVYMRENDLTAPARTCGEQGAGDADVACLEQLGFDLPCAQAWAYDTDNTRNVCIGTCLTRLNDPYNQPDGGLDPCIQCDEDESGPVFKLVAGRTRRNSGLPNAICRPCSQVQPLVHVY